MTLARWIALPALLLALAACEDSGDRAQSFFEDGVELRAAGDLDRAAVSFRNVFRFDGAHKEARTELAEVLIEQGNPNGAYSQYLRLAEQYPEDAEVRLALSALAVDLQSWSELRRHGAVAAELAPDRPETRAVGAMLDYIDATEAEDPAARQAAVERAETLLEEAPELGVARRLAIIGHLEAERFEPALVRIDEALERRPGDRTLSLTKLQVLAAMERDAEVETLLVALYEDFPEDEEIRGALISWYVQQDDLAAVEALLRARAGGPEGTVEDNVTLVQFIAESRGVDAARGALRELIAANEDAPERADRYVQIEAAYAFAAGETEAAIDALRARLEDAAEGAFDGETRTMLARMLVATGEQVGARALVEEVLETDPSNVAALKMQSEWLIEADDPTQAITALRAALDQAPNDPEILTLMARAHVRAGSPELAGERLALAVDLSGNAPEESLRYAAWLADRDRLSAARTLIDESVRANPGDLGLLTEQVRLALRDEDVTTARAAVAALEALGAENPEAADRAQALNAALLLNEERFEEGLALLEARAETEGASGAVALDVVRTRLRAGQTEEARAFLDERLAESPEDPVLRFADAVLRLGNGDAEGGEALLRELIADFPEAEAPVRHLYVVLRRQGREDEAATLLAEGIERIGDAVDLRMLQANTFELAGDMEAALAAYGAIYEIDSDNVVAANNYASMLSDLRDDEASLERAAAIARRLSESGNPALQDTYGWIAYRQGRPNEALRYLEPAAAGLPENPVVIYHLGMTLIALDRIEEGREALERAIALGEGQDLPQIDAAREALQGL